MSDKADAITVRSIMDQFIKSESVKSRLKMIRERDRNDWEKWLQVELEYFISQTDGIYVDREIEAFPDNRKLRERYNMYIDLAIRKKRTRLNAYIFLELKCTRNVQTLINGFESDIHKINAIKKCSVDARSFWCVGFHLNCSERSLTKIKNYVAEWDYGYHEVIKLCDCGDDLACGCTNNTIGFAVI
ncbi:hypothetical protein [Enterobacter huaxiensis]|uniref:Uncharacterized protein n=1 Tax=Enterobacter huaxiensis TaxID=2494702 RepID=A0ABU6EM98_9ENTR|nr:hypothetical protein [Enterobacter huaxiensis]MEB7542052.1 hypothetical protein [Enterobacter huaxiensis]MEB7580889.1 hypothetical protein [Enterobacter huaxiensis]MEB7662974.1 hypothetical protein [Enterobacter huaxiensis]UNC50811.1 hypothetical protein D5067_0014935 [Enterobacter huaxiensis]